ncbi:RsfA family transcriptional regulator [Cytobacillus massiliigabonensis]|uniref:RsfA family transcriptional regulator n=1 Tax=Cytobacillus massiliigabonensis TaxID=1871011 RepID=UPI000C8322AD|nr:RsfA family transcriptional regulator [Cytobacillus massiliigabonensis]
MKVRQDAWTDENDLLLAETVLRHVREGSTQLNAFEEVGDKLDRTSAACGFRWNAVVRHQYEKALQLAKKQRKQRQRILGKDQGGKKKLLYSPPVPELTEIETTTIPLPEPVSANEDYIEEYAEEIIEVKSAPVYNEVQNYPVSSEINLDRVISYLQSLKHSSIQLDILRNENERLKRENAQIKSRNDELEGKIGQLEQNTVTIQEDYETLMKIMNRARKLVLFDEEERPATKFKMDRNGNLEKVAE